MTDNIYQARYTATAGTASVSTGGTLVVHTVVVPKTTGGTLSFQDVTGGVYFAFPTATIAGTYLLDATCNNGLNIIQGTGTDQITTTWKQG
jgi:hypothetical protein